MWHEHLEAVELFGLCQWRGNGVLALDYNCLNALFDMYRVKDKKALFHEVVLIETGVVDYLKKLKK